MKLSNALLAVAALTLVVSLVCIWFYPSFKDFMETNTTWNGVRKFSNNFGAFNINSLDELPDSPDKVVLVAIPYLDYSNEELSKLRKFIFDGGTILLMNDFGYGNSVLEYLGVGARFTNKPLLDPLFCYRNQTMPRITDFNSQVKENNIDVIVLNHATTLANIAESEAIAWSSTASFLDANDNGAWEQNETKGPFVVAAELRLGKGILDLISDPSIVINTMFGRDKNEEFMKYLIQRQGETRKVLVDTSHLPKAPLDVSKEKLMSARQTLSNPYAMLGIIAVVFAVVFKYILARGEVSG